MLQRISISSISITLLLLINSCLIVDPGDVYVMQQEDILGTWYGVSKIESTTQPGYFTELPITVSIKDRYPDAYHIYDTLDFSIQQQTDAGTYYLHLGYLIDPGEEYEASLLYTFRNYEGSKTSIEFTQFHQDSIRIQFDGYIYKVGR